MGSEFLVFCCNRHTLDAPKSTCPSGTLMAVREPFFNWSAREVEPYFKKVLISHLPLASGMEYAEEHRVSGVQMCQSAWVYLEASGCFKNEVTQEVRLLQNL